MPELLRGSVDPISGVILSLAIISIAAKLGGHVAARAGLSPVLGELGAGLVIGHLALIGVRGLDYMKTDAGVDLLARLGVIVLLFQVGLESTVAQMRRVGASALLAATLGVAGSVVLGWAV